MSIRVTNGQYYTFQKLGEYYNMGNTLMVIYAIANTLGQVAWCGRQSGYSGDHIRFQGT